MAADPTAFQRRVEELFDDLEDWFGELGHEVRVVSVLADGCVLESEHDRPPALAAELARHPVIYRADVQAGGKVVVIWAA